MKYGNIGLAFCSGMFVFIALMTTGNPAPYYGIAVFVGLLSLQK